MKNEIKKLKFNARKFYYDTSKTLEEKLDLLELMYAELKISGQKSVPVNDIDARWMYNKKKIKQNFHITFKHALIVQHI